MDTKVKIFLVLLGFFASTEAQFPTCDPNSIDWFAHPHDCESYIICFHGTQNTFSCAPGLHFSPSALRCMPPADARCHVNYLCPPVDDVNNPVFLPDPYDCSIYYICSRGSPFLRECAPGLWWDVNNDWCTSGNDVVCDNRTVINPGNPGSTTTVTPPPGPNLSVCWRRADLFHNGNYMKSFCIINITTNYMEAETVCNTHRMELFVIDDPNTQFQFQTAIRQAMGSEPRNFLWINGRVDDDCGNWYSFNPRRNILPNFIHWVQAREFVGRNTGDCLRYTQQFSPDYFAMGTSCDQLSWMACEFSIPP